MLISFDGVDGAGKSTQIRLFCEWLDACQRPYITCRDPGSTPLGERIREILLQRDSFRIDRRSEMLLYMAARAQLVDEVIRPALAENKIVVSDRYLLANVVYQAHAGGLDVESTWHVGRVATDGLEPDLTIILDIDVPLAMSRLDREPDRIEAQGLGYLQQVRDGFLLEASRSPDKIQVIDASQSVDRIHAEIRHAAVGVLDRS
jgi:dTMP kinase